MAGAGHKKWAAGDVVGASGDTDINTAVLEQVVGVYAASANRDAAFGGTGEPTLAEGMVCYLNDTNELQIYNGSAWVTISDPDVMYISGGAVYVTGDIDGPQDWILHNGEGEQILFQGSSNQVFFQSNGTWRMYVNASGHLQPYANDTYNVGVNGGRWDTIYATDGTINTSDERDKTNIENLDLGLAFVNALRPISYTWDTRSGRVGTRTHMGFSAQEVATVLGDQAADRAVWSDAPAGENINAEGEAVPYDACQGLRYHELIAPLVKAVQELTARLEALEAT